MNVIYARPLNQILSGRRESGLPVTLASNQFAEQRVEDAVELGKQHRKVIAHPCWREGDDAVAVATYSGRIIPGPLDPRHKGEDDKN